MRVFKVSRTSPESWHDGVFTEPLTFELAQAFGHIVPKEFQAMFTFLDDDYVGVWLVYFVIQMTPFGTPEIHHFELTGPSSEIKNGLNFETRLRKHVDTKRVERWHLQYVERNLNDLLRTATINVAEKWIYDDTGTTPRWSRPHNSIERFFTDDEKKILKKSLEKRLHQKITPEFLKRISEIYLEAAKESSKPTKAVANYFGKDIKTAQSWVKRARDQRLLPPTTRGKISGGSSPISSTPRTKKTTQKEISQPVPNRKKSDLSDLDGLMEEGNVLAISKKNAVLVESEASSKGANLNNRRRPSNVKN